MSDERAWWQRAIVRRFRELVASLEDMRENEPDLFEMVMVTPEAQKLREIMTPLEYDL
jgi:hypothetical protein